MQADRKKMQYARWATVCRVCLTGAACNFCVAGVVCGLCVASAIIALAGSASAQPAPDADGAHDSDASVEVVGTRAARTQARAASDFHVPRAVLDAAPRQEGADVLRVVPGLFVGRGEGPAVAQSFMLRGFDAEHGQDIEFRVGGLPINQPAHIHGQGYADLGFLIGEVVNTLRVREGVHDPQQGDFAVAGSIDIELGVAERGIRLQSSLGAFDSTRQLAVWAPEDAPPATFGAVQYARTAGFGENRAGQQGSGIFQRQFGMGRTTVRALGIVHAARADIAGVVAKRDVDSGAVCFTCVYPHATARAQNALAQKLSLGVFAEHRGAHHANSSLGVWLDRSVFRVQQNYTGFLETSRTLANTSGRGDLIEQRQQSLSLGLTARHRSACFDFASWAQATFEVGADARIDTIDQAQALLDGAVRNQTWDERIDASIQASDIGLWADMEWALFDIVRLNLGLRGDLLSYAVDDRLGNFAPLSRPKDAFISGFRRSAMGLAWGPRASLEVRPLWWLSVIASYGEGYRSPQARTLADGETAPFTSVRSADLGLRIDRGDALQITLSGYATMLSDDVAFDAAEGSLERIGATRRVGAVLHVQSRPTDGLVGAISVTVVDATLQEPPPPSADEPQPPFVRGQALPFVPPIVVRADLGAQTALIDDLGARRLTGRLGLGGSVLSARPLPYGDFADPVALLDASAGLQWGALALSLEAFNVLDTQYAAVELNFPSDWQPDSGVRARTPARHRAAGSPMSWMLTFAVTP
ncbi:MAG: iron complex outermembrane receptor protein [Bradymonadia bacterium]|jgi:iron complex outermembrane receptor protein